MSTEEGPDKQLIPEASPGDFPSASRLANRYGAPKPGLSRRTKILAGSAGVLLASLGAAYLALPSEGGTVTFKDVGFSIPDAGRATVDFQVTKAPEATVSCAVQVLNESYAVVGWKNVTVGPSEEKTMFQQVGVRTDSLGVTGGINACWILDRG